MVVVLNRPLLSLKKPTALLTLPVEMTSLNSPLLNGRLQGVNAFPSCVDVLSKSLVTESKLLEVMGPLTAHR